MIDGKFLRGHTEILEVDEQARITELADGKRLAFIKASHDSVYDTYLMVGTDSKILVERAIVGIAPFSAKPVVDEASEFTWE